MKKLTLLLTLCTLFILQTQAQFKTLGKSPTFEEPQKGFAKIIIMKNGNTAYVHLSPDQGINIKMYDPTYKQIFSKNVNHKFGRLKEASLKACMETSGDITLLFSEMEEKVPTLERVVISGTDGSIISQSVLAELTKMTYMKKFAATYYTAAPDFVVRKDPYSESYVVALFNTFVSESDKRVEVVHYNGKNEEISRSFMSTPEEKYKYIHIMDVAVLGDKEAYALIFAYNTHASGGREGELLLANFSGNKKEVEYKTIEISENGKMENAVMKLNRVTNKIHILSLVKVKWKALSTVNVLAHYVVDVKTKHVMSGADISFSDVDKMHRKVFGKNKGYKGMPQNFYINDDGGFSVILEGIKEKTKTSSTGGTSSEIYIENVAVINYSPSGNITSSALIPKSQQINLFNTANSYGVIWEPFYHYKRDFAGQELRKGNQYKSFAYLNGKNNNYILINDLPKNEKKIKKGKIKPVKSVTGCNAYYFKANGTEVLPTRKLVFGSSTNKKESSMGVFTISDYNRNDNVYATLKLEVDGGKKKVRVVWMQPE